MSEIFAYRLKQARNMRGLSMDMLCRKLSGKVGKQSIYKYEKGLMLPDSSTLLALSEALDVNPDFFFRPAEYRIDSISFRKKKSSAKETNIIKETIAENIERFYFIESILGMETDKKELPSNMKADTEEDAKAAARTIRELWNTGSDAIVSSSAILEENGIHVIITDTLKKLDGLSGYVNETKPIIVLNKGFQTEHIRFSAFHELGHLVLNTDDLPPKIVENRCNAFASEILLPTEILKSIMGAKRRSFALEELALIQTQFGISIPAIAYKLHETDIINSNQIKRFWINYKSNNEFREFCDTSRFSEPASTIFESMVYRALDQELITTSKAAALLGRQPSDWR